jgi:hypothetical protein
MNCVPLSTFAKPVKERFLMGVGYFTATFHLSAELTEIIAYACHCHLSSIVQTMCAMCPVLVSV